MESNQFVDKDTLAGFSSALVGMKIERVWLGDYTALYLEIGPLTASYAKSGQPKSQHTAYLGFHWVLESNSGQELASSGVGAATSISSAIAGDVVEAITLSPSNELVVSLSSGRRLTSVASNPAEPDWTLYMPTGIYIALQ